MPNGRPDELKDLPRMILGYIYIFWWVQRARIRYLSERLAIPLLAAFLLYGLLEVILEINGKKIGTSSSIFVRLSFFILISVSLYSKAREWHERRQQFYFIQAAKRVVQLLSPRSETTPERLIPELLDIFSETFELKKKFWSIIMRGGLKPFVVFSKPAKPGIPDASVLLLGADDSLEICYWHPPGNKDIERLKEEGFKIPTGKGVGGYAYRERVVVYVPRRSLGHTIIQAIEEEQPYRMVQDLFLPSHCDNFKSLLSVPLVAYGECYGSLNFTSGKANAFQRLDFEQAMFYGLVVAQVLHFSGVAHLLSRDRQIGTLD